MMRLVGKPRLTATILVAINIAILVVIYQFSEGYFDEVIEEFTGISASWITMGRLEVYDALIVESGGLQWFGSGLGHTMAILAHRPVVDVLNPHSDILKYAIEFGPIISSVLMYVFYRSSMRTRTAFALMIYVNVVFITDNISIYFEVMMLFYILQGFLLLRGDTATR
jgi:hypothetical protein